MDIIKKTRNDIKAYVKSLNTPENTVYQENELLILSCFAKAQEILEENESEALIIPDVSQQRNAAMRSCDLKRLKI
tara:strand:- start:314 stop:541 length:228 start_codon:yes stop_codon:yes gene_type:complete